MEFDQLYRVAGELYAFFQSRLEEADAHRLVSLLGTFDDANDYTQGTFCAAVVSVIEWLAIETRGPDREGAHEEGSGW